MPLNKREKMMMPQDPRMQLTPKLFPNAFAPFPRSSWINPLVPIDNYDCLCKIIWMRAKEAELGRVPLEKQQDEDRQALASKPSRRAEEQQKKMDDLGLRTQYEEDKRQHGTDFTLPCPYLSGHRHVAKPARIPSLAKEGEMKRYEEEAKGQRNLEETEDQQRSFQTPPKTGLVPQSTRQSYAPDPKPLMRNPASSATLDNNRYLQKERPPLPYIPRNTCESENELSIRSSSESTSSDDDDSVTLPGARTCASGSSEDDLAGEDCKEEQSTDELSSDREQDSSSSNTEQGFPPLSTIKAGIRPCPTKPLASGKKHGQWENPLLFQPHDIPTATLANGTIAHAQAHVQGKAEAPRANTKTNAPPSAPMQQEAYDLLADFPALGPPAKPLAKGEMQDVIPKAKEVKRKGGRTHLPNHRQESEASHQRKVEIVPHEVSSICAEDQKSVPDLQTFGSPGNSQTISCEEVKAKNQPSPRVAGTDGVGGNARSWANAAKAGMKQAAAPQERARPCTFRQTVTINRAKARHTASQNFTNYMTPSHQAVRPLMAAMSYCPRPRHPNRFVRPGHIHPHQHFGAQVHRANCPPGFRWPCFPFQQVGGNLYKHSHV